VSWLAIPILQRYSDYGIHRIVKVKAQAWAILEAFGKLEVVVYAILRKGEF